MGDIGQRGTVRELGEGPRGKQGPGGPMGTPREVQGKFAPGRGSPEVLPASWQQGAQQDGLHLLPDPTLSLPKSQEPGQPQAPG